MRRLLLNRNAIALAMRRTVYPQQPMCGALSQVLCRKKKQIENMSKSQKQIELHSDLTHVVLLLILGTSLKVLSINERLETLLDDPRLGLEKRKLRKNL